MYIIVLIALCVAGLGPAVAFFLLYARRGTKIRAHDPVRIALMGTPFIVILTVLRVLVIAVDGTFATHTTFPMSITLSTLVLTDVVMWALLVALLRAPQYHLDAIIHNILRAGGHGEPDQEGTV